MLIILELDESIQQMNYHIALEERVRKLVAEGREVIVLGTV